MSVGILLYLVVVAIVLLALIWGLHYVASTIPNPPAPFILAVVDVVLVLVFLLFVLHLVGFSVPSRIG